MTASAVESDLLRHAVGHFATGVTIVTTVGPDGEPVGTTATAVASLSLEPALVLVCLEWRSATLRAILGHRGFALNILDRTQEAVSANFARRGDGASWARIGFNRWDSGCPALHGVLAGIDCAVDQVLTGGDHEIVIGRVRDAAVNPAGDRPLLHWRGAYAGLEPA